MGANGSRTQMLMKLTELCIEGRIAKGSTIVTDVVLDYHAMVVTEGIELLFLLEGLVGVQGLLKANPNVATSMIDEDGTANIPRTNGFFAVRFQTTTRDRGVEVVD